jgi:hypothetical protein
VIQSSRWDDVDGGHKRSVFSDWAIEHVTFEFIAIHNLASSGKFSHKAFHLGDELVGGQICLLHVGESNTKHIDPMMHVKCIHELCSLLC